MIFAIALVAALLFCAWQLLVVDWETVTGRED